MPAVAFTAGLQLIALIALCLPNYAAKGWHGALFTIAMVIFAIAFNWYATNRMPLVQGLVVTIHVFGFFAFVVIIWGFGPREPASVVFTQFQDQSGWGSYGLATLVSVLGPGAAFIGADAAVHLAEELKDAAYVLPRAMLSSACINYATGFVMIISLVSAIKPDDLTDILGTLTGQPWVAVVQLATGSQAATIALTVLVCFQFTFTSVNQVTTSSRQLWAFARDKGVPSLRTLSKVSPSDGVSVPVQQPLLDVHTDILTPILPVPRNAVFVTLGTTIVLSMVIIGSSIAFNVILSICNVALIVTSILCIGTLIAKRLRREKLPRSRFNLGKAGLWVNVGSFCWLLVLATFLFFPSAPNPDPAAMNWACVMFGAVVIFAFVWYVIRGRHEYDGPVEYIRRDVE